MAVDGPRLRGVGQVAYDRTVWGGSGPTPNGLVRRGWNRGRNLLRPDRDPSRSGDSFAVFVLSLQL